MKRTSELDLFFTSLFAGEVPSEGTLRYFRGLREKDLTEYQKSWTPARREAARYLLQWNGFSSDAGVEAREMIRDGADSASKGLYPLAESAEEAVLRGEYTVAEALYREFWLKHREELSGERLYSYNFRRAVARSRRAGDWIVLLDSRSPLESLDAEEAFFRAWCLEQENRNTEALEWYDTAGTQSELR